MSSFIKQDFFADEINEVMSRLIVKNLPFSITDSKLRTTFAKHGSVTDLQLKYKDGKFRGFAFIGYQTDEEASAAKKYLDGTFVGAAKIKVELCNDLGDSSNKKSKNKEKTVSEDKKKKKESQDENNSDKYKDDPKFKEFMSVHSAKDSWGNNNSKTVSDTTAKGDSDSDDEEDDKEPSIKEADKDESEPKSSNKTKKAAKEKKPKPFKELFTVKISNLPFKCKKKDLKAFFSPQKPASLRLPPKIKGIAFVGFLTEKEQKIALNKHKSFLGEHQVQVITHKEQRAAAVQESKWSKQEAALDGVETVGESGRIFARNLPYSATEEDITELFSKFGPLTETTVPVDRNTRKYKGKKY